MNKKDERRVVRFLSKHHLLTICGSDSEENWCASCFYAFHYDEMFFVISSDKESLHGKLFEKNNKVSGTIALETKIPGRIRGVQFRGEIIPDNCNQLYKVYLNRFPYAKKFKPFLWRININYMKMTDNRLGFGKKIHWEINK